jgi:hypothetical protein
MDVLNFSIEDSRRLLIRKLDVIAHHELDLPTVVESFTKSLLKTKYE